MHQLPEVSRLVCIFQLRQTLLLPELVGHRLLLQPHLQHHRLRLLDGGVLTIGLLLKDGDIFPDEISRVENLKEKKKSG